MLLRRITAHVKAQNWFAVVVDFVIVVVGVFIGLQVSNWNDDLGDRADEQRYLAELEKDLDSALDEIDETIGNAELRRDAGALVFANSDQLTATPTFKQMGATLSVDGELNADPTDHLPLIFSIARIVDRHGDAYAELIATGRISVLEDRSLVRALSKYYSRYDEIQTGDQMNWNQMFATQRLFQSRGISIASAMRVENFRVLIKRDAELAAAVRNVSDLAGWQLNRLSFLRADTETVRKQVRDARN